MRRWIDLCAALFVVLSGAAVMTLAQDADRYAPKPPPHTPGPTTLPAVPPQENPPSDEVLHQSLRGIVFVDSFDKVKAGGVEAEGVTFDGTLLNDGPFIAGMRSHLGKPLTANVLNAITADVVLFYRTHDRPVVDAFVPEQDVTTGVIQVVVLEGRVGRVQVEGAKHFSGNYIRRQVRLQPGDTISERRLLEDLDWINDNPFVHADLIFQRGAGLGQTDLILDTRDQLPIRLYGGYENVGTESTGEDRILAGFNWGNVWGLGHQLNYQFTTAPSIKNFNSNWLSYTVPLPWRHTLTLFGNYTQTASVLEDLFNLKGRSWQASARYAVPLPRFDTLQHWVEGGFDFKRSNNNLEFGGDRVFFTDTDIVQWSLAYRAQERDRWGATQGTLSLVLSPGGLTADNSDETFRRARPGADPRYVYLNLRLERTTGLPMGFTWVTRVEGQVSDSALLGSEQMGFGGMYSIRGYDERVVNGDQGFIVSNEVLTPAVSVAKLLRITANDRLQFLVFFDYGESWNRDPIQPDLKHVRLAGVGPGVRYSVLPWLTIRYDYGFQLLDVPGQEKNGRHHVSVIASWSF